MLFTSNFSLGLDIIKVKETLSYKARSESEFLFKIVQKSLILILLSK